MDRNSATAKLPFVAVPRMSKSGFLHPELFATAEKHEH